MAKQPAFLLYSQDFIIGCAEMSNEEIGQYFRILCYMHQKGRMREETIRLLVGSLSVNVRLKFEQDNDGFLFNEKLENVIFQRENFIKSRRENGSKGGRPKDKKPNGKPKNKLHKSYIKATEDENEDENEDNKNSVDRKIPPSENKVKTYFQEKGFSDEAEKFYDFYESKNWMVGKNKMTNWRSAANNWMRKQFEQNGKRDKRTESQRRTDERNAAAATLLGISEIEN